MSKQKEKLMDLIFDRLTNLDPIVEFLGQKGSSRFEVKVDGKKLTVEVFE